MTICQIKPPTNNNRCMVYMHSTCIHTCTTCTVHVHALTCTVRMHALTCKCTHVRTCILHVSLKAGSQYDAGRCVASRHASLKCCRNATRRWNRTKFYSCVRSCFRPSEVDLGQSLPTCPKIDVMRRSAQRHIVNQPLSFIHAVDPGQRCLWQLLLLQHSQPHTHCRGAAKR